MDSDDAGDTTSRSIQRGIMPRSSASSSSSSWITEEPGHEDAYLPPASQVAHSFEEIGLHGERLEIEEEQLAPPAIHACRRCRQVVFDFSQTFEESVNAACATEDVKPYSSQLKQALQQVPEFAGIVLPLTWTTAVKMAYSGCLFWGLITSGHTFPSAEDAACEPIAVRFENETSHLIFETGFYPMFLNNGKYGDPRPITCAIWASEGTYASMIVKRRPINCFPDSRTAMQAISKWLNAGFARTGEDAGLNLTFAPRLLIKVDMTNSIMQARLVEHLPPLVSYAVLSYCWGGNQIHKTTTQNVSEYMSGLDIGKLPRTIQDALKVTVDLGFSYLYVDSLCIVQD